MPLKYELLSLLIQRIPEIGSASLDSIVFDHQSQNMILFVRKDGFGFELVLDPTFTESP